MGIIIGAVILGITAVVCFVISCLSFHEKGLLVNNAYLYATKEEREKMDKKPYYRQTGMAFALLGCIFAVNAVETVLQTDWLSVVVIGIVAVAIVYAIVSSVMIEKRYGEGK